MLSYLAALVCELRIFAKPLNRSQGVLMAMRSVQKDENESDTGFDLVASALQDASKLTSQKNRTVSRQLHSAAYLTSVQRVGSTFSRLQR